ncbi:MAG: gph [Anaerosporomusa subterranea]|jgi:FMN phosphatase YigB (HAD superfamily)|nr:gph [Anaerosporomusa subterranea]
MIKAVLFDLDGTLLPFDHELFLREYTTLIGGHVAHLVNPSQFVTQLLASTAVMVANNNPSRTNQTVFSGDFYAKVGVDASTLELILEDFYVSKFPQLSKIVRPSAAARRAVQAVLDRGLQTAVATNPIFPQIAVEERLRWAGVYDLPFVHITSYEKSHFCKPNPAYYLEVAAAIGREPEECLMVGNDVEEDLIAAEVGMKTYLVTDCLINAKRLTRSADAQGTLDELAAWLQEESAFAH